MPKTNPWLYLFIVAVVVIFCIAICTPRRTDSISKDKYAALEQNVKDTARYYEEMLKADSAAINSAEQATADQVEKLQVAQGALSASQVTINRLTAQVRAAKAEPKDNSWVEVSPNYVKNCDSLTDHIADLGKKVDEYEEQSAELVKLMSYEVSIRDSILNNEREFNAKFRTQLDNCMLQLKEGNKQALPRRQIYGELGLIGNKMHPVAGGSAGLTLINKNGQMYGLKGQHIRNELFVEAKTGFKLSFRK